MKRSRYEILLVACLMIASSCTKLKDNNYSDLIATEFEPTEKEVGTLLGAAYGSWREVLFPNDYSEGQWLVQEMGGDVMCIPKKPFGWVDGGRHRRMHEHSWTVDDSYITSVWGPTYQGISNCNRVLSQIELMTSMDADTKATLLAEVRVLRASFYWMLCDNFGNIPVLDKFDVPEGFLPEQRPRKEVYDFIVKEITESLPFLKDAKDESTYARFNNKGAANALLAKVYLNAEVYTGTAEWEKCIAACDEIIASGLYSLEGNQRNVFKEQNQGSGEILFSVPFDVVYTPIYDHVNLMFDYCLVQQMQEMFNLQHQPWGGIVAIPQFIKTFDPNDTRLTEGWFYGQLYSKSGEPLKVLSGELDSNMNIINEVPGIDSAQEYHGYKWNKYEIVEGGQTDMCNNDFVVLRYADVLMMKAECLLRTGQPGAGLLVTDVRLRSFPDHPELATVTDEQLQESSVYDYGLRDHLATTHESPVTYLGRFYDELGWEFAGEGRRRQDMIRFNTFTTKSWLSHSPNGDNKKLFPIPLNELNNNVNLKQNPGY
ncbi:MAG: RagB/SusD family nutrient uptake outer membrane protein [Chitinophagaceae bacterium]|nr:RagB/SusD family nutrient uptake outer membrane protein [Chitinophagaceae bacterium]